MPENGMKLRELEDQLLQSNPAFRAGYENASAAAKMGALLQSLREHNGLTQRELSAASGVQQSEISRHEGGQAPRGLTISQLETIAHAQGVEVVIGFAKKAVAADESGLVIDGRTVLMHTIL
jgi:transcriptional regulator with XRE-family HTH domain